MPTPKNHHRLVELDSIRGLAAIVVLLFHAGSWTRITLLDKVFNRGWMAVDLFFLLSGFLITSILLKHQGPLDQRFLLAFYARRTLRIWPIYYLLLAIVAGLSWSGIMPASWPPFTPRLLFHYLTFTQAITSYWGDLSACYPPLAHYWSLAVEEQFYLFWPFVIGLVGRRGVIPVSLALIVGSMIYRTAFDVDLFLLLARCDALAFGAILAALLTGEGADQRRRLAPPWFAAISLGSVGLLLAWAHWISHDLHSTRLLLFANPTFFGMVGLLICGSGQRWLAPLRARWLVYLGQISYGLYVYHFAIFMIVDSLTGDSVHYVPLKLALTFPVAILSWHFIEVPILSKKALFPYESTRSARADLPVQPTVTSPVAAEHLFRVGHQRG